MSKSELNTNSPSDEDPLSIENALNLFISLRDSGVILTESYFEQINFYDKHGDSKIRPIKGRQSFIQKINEQKLEWLAYEAKTYLANSRALEKSISKKSLSSRKNDLNRDLIKLTKDELIEKYSILTLKHDQAITELAVQKAINSYLSDNLLESLSLKKKAGINKTGGIYKKFASNNACMRECLDEVLDAGSEDKQLTKATYRKFHRLVTNKYPMPPVIQKFRQSKDEKLQDPEIQKADLEATKRNEWAPTTLRNFFETTLKVKIKDLP